MWVGQSVLMFGHSWCLGDSDDRGSGTECIGAGVCVQRRWGLLCWWLTWRLGHRLEQRQGYIQVSGELCPQHVTSLVSLWAGDLGSEFFAGWSLRYMVTLSIALSQTMFWGWQAGLVGKRPKCTL